jgi:hypothetical protein
VLGNPHHIRASADPLANHVIWSARLLAVYGLAGQVCLESRAFSVSC